MTVAAEEAVSVVVEEVTEVDVVDEGIVDGVAVVRLVQGEAPKSSSYVKCRKIRHFDEC